jgi:hypothetical protein
MPETRRYGAVVAGGWDETQSKDWGASEVHDWGVASPSGTAPAWRGADEVEPEAAVVADGEDGGSGGSDGEEGDDDPVASYVELAMDNLQHSRARVEADEESAPLYCLGSGDVTVYAIEDGPGRLMIGRGVGRDDDGCVYCLVGAASTGLLDALDAGEVPLDQAFDDATDLTLCSVFEADQVDNVVLVQHYEGIEDVPGEYRPGRPFLRFTDE